MWSRTTKVIKDLDHPQRLLSLSLERRWIESLSNIKLGQVYPMKLMGSRFKVEKRKCFFIQCPNALDLLSYDVVMPTAHSLWGH